LINVAGLAKALAVHLQSELPVTKRVMNVEDAAEYCGLPQESFKGRLYAIVRPVESSQEPFR
jgi:hypothetical protein